MPDSTFTLKSPMPASADEVYAWHARPLAFERLTPPWEDTRVVKQEGAFGTAGFRTTVRTKVAGPLSGTWLAEMYDFQPGRRFQDRQLKGPFAFWNHTHLMIPDTDMASVLEDHIEYRPPLGLPGRVFGGGIVRKRLAAVFAYRHFVTASDLRRHAKFAHRPRLTVAVTGSRGMIGADLVPFLTTGGHKVVRLVTGDATPPYADGTKWVPWKPDAPLDAATLDGVDAVVHLAGENVADGRWTEAKKRAILHSRTGPTNHIADAIAALPQEKRPKVFVCASAVGFYGTRGDEDLTEESLPGTGFFPDVVKGWEGACAPARDAGVRTANVRFGVVLTPKGGALGKQLTAFRAGAGATLGSGKQWTPWITANDAVGAIHEALMNDGISGPVNTVAPNPVTNHEFAKTLGRVLRRPAFVWLPRAALRALFGEVADEALLASIRARPAKLTMSGFAFDHSDLEGALRFVLGR